MEQLIYGSADQIAGRQVGGWGVLHASPGLQQETSRRLLPLVSVALPHTLPQFPSVQQLAGRAVRFRLDPVGTQYAACHSVEAGSDHTGRPGNVISHCARITAVPGVRPVDWFFSPGWLAPYGPRQIAEAALPAELPAPGGWQESAAWVIAEPGRVARLRWIVDVALEILMRHRLLVLRSPSTEEAARWVSLLSWMLDPAMAGQLRLRIGEDAVSARAEAAVTPAIVAITSEPGPDPWPVPIVDTSLLLDAGEAHRTGVWTLPTGASFPVSSIQVAADLVYAPAEVAQAVFAQRDAFAARAATIGAFAARSSAIGAPLSGRLAGLFLSAAWLATPGAQSLARAEPIRALLDSVEELDTPDGGLRAWEEIAALAAEIGAPAPAALDVYAAASPIDPWIVEDEPEGGDDALPDDALPDERFRDESLRDGALLSEALLPEALLVEALVAAARLGAHGVDVAALLRSGSLLDGLEQRPEEHQVAVRRIAAVLPHPSHEEEDH